MWTRAVHCGSFRSLRELQMLIMMSSRFNLEWIDELKVTESGLWSLEQYGGGSLSQSTSGQSETF